MNRLQRRKAWVVAGGTPAQRDMIYTIVNSIMKNENDFPLQRFSFTRLDASVVRLLNFSTTLNNTEEKYYY